MAHTANSMIKTKTDDTMLDEYREEDVFDVVVKLQKSFGLKFADTAFENVKTFGELCDVFDEYLKYKQQDDCTTQQAFYKIRKAVSKTLLINESAIKPGTRLIDLFPRQNRRTKVKEFKSYLGINIDVLTYPGWVVLIFIIGFLASLILFFFDWKIAASGIVFFILAIKIADKLGKDLDMETVEELTEKVAREHYIDARRFNSTINRKEILPIITDAFSNQLYIDKAYLTRDAKFKWA